MKSASESTKSKRGSDMLEEETMMMMTESSDSCMTEQAQKLSQCQDVNMSRATRADFMYPKNFTLCSAPT